MTMEETAEKHGLTTDELAMLRGLGQGQVPGVVEQIVIDREAAIRRDERERLAQLIEENAETIATFAGGKEQVARLVALCLRLDKIPENVANFAPKETGDAC